MKTIHIAVEDADYDIISSKKKDNENWTNYLKRIVGAKDE